MANSKLKIYLAALWLLLTSSLILWWMYFALGLVSQLGADASRHQNMLILEGFTLLLLLLAGGGTLIYLISQEGKRINMLQSFFAAFSHDMKTAVASLRLQTESLQQDLGTSSELQPVLGRLVADTSRILVATDNSLHFANSGQQKLFKESLSLESFILKMKDSWPQLNIEVTGHASVKADKRALHIVFENLFQNAIAHGESTEVRISIETQASKVLVEVCDNGKGFSGDLKSLGEAFRRHSVTSGSGLGLSIVKSLIEQMGGHTPTFKNKEPGFCIQFQIPKGDS